MPASKEKHNADWSYKKHADVLVVQRMKTKYYKWTNMTKLYESIPTTCRTRPKTSRGKEVRDHKKVLCMWSCRKKVRRWREKGEGKKATTIGQLTWKNQQTYSEAMIYNCGNFKG